MGLLKDEKAVSEIIGMVLLLAITVSAFSAIYLEVLSDEGPQINNIVTLVGRQEFGNIIMEHQKGESIKIDSEELQ